MNRDVTHGLPPPFDDAMRLHERAVMRFLVRMTGDREDALDLFQETWLRAYRSYPQLDSAAGLKPWLFRIAVNLCRNRARDRARRFAALSNGNTEAGGAGGVEGLIDLRRAIQALPGKQGTAFVLRRALGLDYAEIGEAIGCSAESARAGVYQALKKLRSVR